LDNRLDSILTLLNLKQRILRPDTFRDKNVLEEIDYSRTESGLQNAIDASFSFLDSIFCKKS